MVQREFKTSGMVHRGFAIPMQSHLESIRGIASGIIEMPADFAPMGYYLSFLGMQRNSS